MMGLGLQAVRLPRTHKIGWALKHMQNGHAFSCFSTQGWIGLIPVDQEAHIQLRLCDAGAGSSDILQMGKMIQRMPPIGFLKVPLKAQAQCTSS